jgi:hypothetical protein
MNFLKRQLPVLVAFCFGMAMWAQYFIPTGWSQRMLERFTTSWYVTIVASALILGVVSAIHYHGSKISRRKPGFAYSAITLAAFAITAFLGLFPYPLFGLPSAGLGDGSPILWVFNNIFFPLEATLFALLAFFIASAAFRAFRARSPEATVLLIAGMIVMLGRTSLGATLFLFPAVPAIGIADAVSIQDVSGWIFSFPNTAAQRGILLGVVLSQVAISLRIIFGIERTYMGGGDD